MGTVPTVSWLPSVTTSASCTSSTEMGVPIAADKSPGADVTLSRSSSKLVAASAAARVGKLTLITMITDAALAETPTL